MTDHGSQFRQRFHESIESLGFTHVRCKLRTWHLNAKVERAFRDLKPWMWKSCIVPRTTVIQRRLDAYLLWHSTFRPHAAHDTLTPLEAEGAPVLPEPILCTERGELEPSIVVRKACVRGDQRLAYPVIHIREKPGEAA
ncbi:MAG: hypothetical protein AAGB51_04870 [Planctomycetota bacterium]